MTLLDISELTLDLPNGTRLLDGISLTVAEGETVGLVGESGSGKSLTARSVLGLLPDRAEHRRLRAAAGPRRCSARAASELLDLRRTSASMIFQDPRAGINPMRTVGDHLTETMRLCEERSAADARARGVDTARGGAPAATRGAPAPVPARALGRHAAARHDRGRAHELASAAHLRRADDGARRDHAGRDHRGARRAARESRHGHALHHARPESRGVDLRSRLRHERGPGRGAGRRPTGVPRSAGRVHEAARRGDAHDRRRRRRRRRRRVDVERGARGPIRRVRYRRRPEPEVSIRASRYSTGDAEPMLVASGLSKTYLRRGKEPVRAVIDASIEIPRGGALGVVGESGSGKSTLARMIVGLEQADAGRHPHRRPRTHRRRRPPAGSASRTHAGCRWCSRTRTSRSTRGSRQAGRSRTRCACTPASPRPMRVRACVELLDQVGLGDRHAQARPRTLSGGQRQRVAIARALAIEPDVLVMDEATSALDVSVQAQVLDVVERIRRERGLTVLFISHDLAVVRRLCDETVVMQTGEIVERGRTVELLERSAAALHAAAHRLGAAARLGLRGGADRGIRPRRARTAELTDPSRTNHRATRTTRTTNHRTGEPPPWTSSSRAPASAA